MPAGFRLLRSGTGVSTTDGGSPCSDGEDLEGEPPALPEDIHTYALLAALGETAGCERGIAMPLLSLGFVLIQLLLLVIICCDTTMTRCVWHGQCQQGQWCAPSYTFWGLQAGSVRPGFCSDCFDAYTLYNISHGRPVRMPDTLQAGPFTGHDQLRLRANTAGEEWLARGVAHCDETDQYPDQCDFIHVNRMLVSGGSIIVLWLTVCMVAVAVMEDMNEAGQSLTLLEAALNDASQPPLHGVVLALFWCSFNTRLYLLPTAVTITTTAVLLTTSPTATNIVMNGVVFTFLLTLDDMAAQLLPRRVMLKAERVRAKPFVAAAVRTAGSCHWRGFHKLMAVFVAGGIPFIDVHMDWLLSLPVLNSTYHVGQLCFAIPMALLRLTLIGSVAMAVMRPVSVCYGMSLTSYLQTSLSARAAMVLDAVLVPLFITVTFATTILLGFVIHSTHA